MVSEPSAPGDAPAESEKRAPCYLIHDASFDPQEFGEALDVTPVPAAEREQVPAQSRVLLYLGDEQIRDLAPLALERRWEVGLLAHPEAGSANAALGVRGKPAELMAHYRDIDPIETDVLTCNGELVFSSVVVGRVLSLRPYDINRPQTRWSFFSGAM